MEAWEIEIITENLDKLTSNTACNPDFLTKFQASKTFSQEDVDELSLLGDTPVTRSSKFYRKIVTREHGFTKLMAILKETNQVGVRNILKTAITRYSYSQLEEIASVSYDRNVVLGKGSNATVVFKGGFGGRYVAVKRVNSDNEQEKMITQEIENIKKCEGHENIVRYYGAAVVENFLQIVLELCEMTIKDWLPNKPINISPVEVLRQVTFGLEWLHVKRIVHRDLKPENILLTSCPIRAKISDFGLSRSVAEERNYVSSFGGGTQGWVAPEILMQFDAEDDYLKFKFTFESDIFSLGCVYYYVLTDGKHPFGSRVMRNGNILNGKNTVDPSIIQYASAENFQFIILMISKDPQSRPSCSTLLTYPIFMKNTEKLKITTNKNRVGDDAATTTMSQIVKVPYPISKPKPSIKEPEWSDTTFENMFPDSTLVFKAQDTRQVNPTTDMVKETIYNKFMMYTDSSKMSENHITIPPTAKPKILQIIEPVQIRSVSRNSAVSSKSNPAQLHFNTKEPIKANSHFNDIKLDQNQQQTINKFLNKMKRGSFRTSLLLNLVKDEDLTVIKVVLDQSEAGSKVNMTEVSNQDGKTMLHFAVERGNYDIVEYLINCKDFDKVLLDPIYQNVIYYCMYYKIHEIDAEEYAETCKILELFFSKHPQLIESYSHGMTPLQYATLVEFGNGKQVEFIKFLLKHNANVNSRNSKNYSTPLHTAVKAPVSTNVIEIIRLLITLGADTNAVNKDGYKFWQNGANEAPPDLYEEILHFLVSIKKVKQKDASNELQLKRILFVFT